VILFEKESEMHMFGNNPKIEKKLFPERVTYADWLKLTNALSPNTVSILSNSDIYFDGSLKYLVKNKLSIIKNKLFIALSRYNLNENTIELNENPHWTQDSWIVGKSSESFHSALFQEARFELGHPGCDNKIAYVMHSYGYHITNPCYEIKSIHLHADPGRDYDSKANKLIGLHAFVYPTKSIYEISKLDFDLLSRNEADTKKIS
jgi:hypothetical protein